MKNFKLYYREHHCWLEMDEESYLKIRRERQRIYYKRKKADECYCTTKNAWRCDGMCETCRYFKNTDMLLSKMIGDSDDLTIAGCLSDNGLHERKCLERIMSKEVLAIIEKTMPELLDYGKLKMEGLTDQEIAMKWGVSRTAIYKKVLKMKGILLTNFEDF